MTNKGTLDNTSGTIEVGSLANLRQALALGGAVKLTGNITVGDAYIRAYAGSSSLDINGHTIACGNKGIVVDGGNGKTDVSYESKTVNFTITDSSAETPGSITGTGESVIYVQATADANGKYNSTLTATGVIIKNTGEGDAHYAIETWSSEATGSASATATASKLTGNKKACAQYGNGDSGNAGDETVSKNTSSVTLQ